MRVLYVSKALVVAAYRDKLRALNARVQVSAVIPHRWGRRPVEPSEPAAIEVEQCVTLLHGHNHLHVYRGLRPLLDRYRPDLVHIDEEPYSAAAFQISLLCAQRGTPCLVFAWQNLHKRLPFPFRQMRASVFRRVTGAIAGTEAAADVLIRAGYDKPLTVIPQFGVDPFRFRPDAAARAALRTSLGAGDSDFVIGFGGRLVKEKGVEMLLAAVRSLPAAHLLIIGDGPERKRIAGAALRDGLRDRVHLVGAVASCSMPRWLVACDVVVLPSLSAPGWKEQFGRILIEAMASGVPVIGSDSGEIPRVIGDAGWVFPEGDLPALLRALQRLADSLGDRRDLALAGRARACRLYDQERLAAMTVEFYRSLVAGRTRERQFVT